MTQTRSRLFSLFSAKYVAVALFALALFSGLALAKEKKSQDPNTPEMVRIETGNVGRFIITYTTGSSASCEDDSDPKLGTHVYYGKSKTNLDKIATGKSSRFVHDKYSATVHVVEMPTLEANTVYYYKVGDLSFDNGLSDIYMLDTRPPKTWAVYGDFGVTNEEKSLSPLLKDGEDRLYQGVLHVGDIAYDLHNAKGGRGDQFLNSLQSITGNMPYMLAAGNHESHDNFTHVHGRFPGLELIGRDSKSNTKLWYSFNQPYVHFVVIDTEVYKYFPDEAQQKRQLDWLRADLTWANQNRNKYPWVVMLGHKCDWQDNVKFDDFRTIAHSYGVDLLICGHQHNYQRLFPGLRSKVQVYDDPEVFTDPKYWVQIVVGSPGCQENISSGVAPYKNGLASYFLSYGFGFLTIHNSTHLEWQWKQTHKGDELKTVDETAARLIKIQNALLGATADKASIKDRMMIIQHYHGPRNY